MLNYLGIKYPFKLTGFYVDTVSIDSLCDKVSLSWAVLAVCLNTDDSNPAERDRLLVQEKERKVSVLMSLSRQWELWSNAGLAAQWTHASPQCLLLIPKMLSPKVERVHTLITIWQNNFMSIESNNLNEAYKKDEFSVIFNQIHKWCGIYYFNITVARAS